MNAHLGSASKPTGPPSAMRRWLAALEMTSGVSGDPFKTFPRTVDELAERHGDAAALLSDAECLTFRSLSGRSNRYSRWALDHGLERGDAVCLLMPNRPEYVAIWVGLSRVGCVVALLNTNLTGSGLAHCVSIVSPKHIIVAADLMPAFDSIATHITSPPRLWRHGPALDEQGDMIDRIDRAVERYDDAPLKPEESPPVRLSDRALYIYTSGTTGLPKAARVSHRRIQMWSFWFAGLLGTTPQDRMYNCLPLYHSVGGIVAVGSVLVGGGAVVIREKFSARRFWEEVVAWDCTLFQYIGELCRYLLLAPPAPIERQHRLRLACGNGLRADVWSVFQDRFAIPQVLEFYAATEGNFSLFNVEGEVGAIGRIPPFLAHRFPAAVVQSDPDLGEPLRDEYGFCIRCARNETGEAIGLIGDGRSSHGGEFEGYTNPVESAKKVLRNVFKEGDSWFRTGDLMRVDDRGFYYFVDRIGDTFRWKGENVATSEVAAALMTCPGVLEADVYGVSIPGIDGKAGMAAVVTDPAFSLQALHSHLAKRLPAYARPLFVRLRREIEVTETFKHKKAALAREGFDPAAIEDPLFFDDARTKTYVRLDRPLFGTIVGGTLRV